MTSFRNFSLTLFAGSALLLAQDPQAGGWRRAGDPPPPQAPGAPVAQNPAGDPAVLDQDPSQPVARSDGYGQPEPLPQQRPTQQLPQSVRRPPCRATDCLHR